MSPRTSLFVFVVIVIAVNNAALFLAARHRQTLRVHSLGLLIALFSLIEIVAIGIKISISVKQ